jgi:ribonuclease P protein component
VVQKHFSAADHPVRNTLHKSEILRGDEHFRRLLRDGNTVRTDTIQCYFIEGTDDRQRSAGVLVGFSVPKRSIRKAVHRNRIKRLLREAYRKNKEILTRVLATKKRTVHVLFIYRGHEPQYNTRFNLHFIEPHVVRCLELVKDRISGELPE